MPKKAYVVDAEKLPRQERYGGMFGETAVLMDHALIKFAWAKGQSGDMTGRTAAAGTPDVHPWDQAIIMIRGWVEVTLGEDGCEGTHKLGPGYIVYIPANMPHIGRCISEEDSFGVDIFAPVRDDYLDMAQHQIDHENS